MMKCIYAVLVFSVLSACGAAVEEKEVVEKEEFSESMVMINSIEKAHKIESFKSNEAIQFDLNLTFGGKQRFNGTITMLTNGSKILMSDTNGTKFWNGEKAFLLPTMQVDERAKFGLLTWSYFFAAPYKLNDPGTFKDYLSEKQLGDNTYEAFKLTFGESIGDSPEDWYIVYKDYNSDLLAGMAYIVTGGETTVADAEKDPHLITYEAYTEIGGIPFATQWNFWTWNQKGEMQKLLGSATLSNVKLIKKAGDLFNHSAS